MKRLYDARPSNIRPFMDKGDEASHFLNSDLPNVCVSSKELFPIPTFEYATVPFISTLAITYSKIHCSACRLSTRSPTTAVSIVVIRPSTLMVRNVQITLAVES
ncbi:hypothetical protein TNCV_99751 [Trichonephila clavipes]|nr:hypothetical protein TNCV_99751 [Trichonephila clavipes]